MTLSPLSFGVRTSVKMRLMLFNLTPHIRRWEKSVVPGVSMMVRLGQNLYSILTTISLAQNWCSRSNRAFSFSMYS